MVFKDAGYDPEKDFVPVSQVSDYQFAIAVGAAIPLKEVNHLFAWLRSNPDRANFGVPATGSLPHFFGLMLAEQAKVSPQIIGYKGSAPLQTDLIGGQVPVAIDTLDSLYALHQAGKLRILASSGEQRASFARDIPTFREAGLKLSANGWNTFFAPVQMPTAKVQWLANAIRAAMQEPSIRQAFEKVFMTPVITTQEETRRALAQYRAQWLPVVQRSHFEP
jgi:tripartite-type tricarboxylate transporter receptor subunit TctC